jgi:hypothetical protein
MSSGEIRPPDYAAFKKLESRDAFGCTKSARVSTLTSCGSTCREEPNVAGAGASRRRRSVKPSHAVSIVRPLPTAYWSRSPIYGPVSPGNVTWFSPDVQSDHATYEGAGAACQSRPGRS